MKFELNFKETNFIIEIEEDKHFVPDNRFEKISNQVLIELKKKKVLAYSLLIISKKVDQEVTHYWSSVLLTSNQDEVLEELQDYLDDENIIEDILEKWEIVLAKDGPSWK